MHSLDPPQRTKIRSFPGAERRFTNRFVHPSGFATTKGLNPGHSSLDDQVHHAASPPPSHDDL